MKRYFASVVALSMLLMLTLAPSKHAQAAVRGWPTILTCVNTIGWENVTAGGCWWNAALQGAGINLITRAEPMGRHPGGVTENFNTSYVPYSGTWRLRMYFCPSDNQYIRCTVANASTYVDSVNAVALNSTATLVDQDPNFGGAPGGNTPVNVSTCYAFVEINAPTVAWHTVEPMTCQDGGTLPDEPATCYINENNNLDVNMGTLERGELVSTPGTSANTVKKTIPVLCTRDGGVTVTTQFQFTPISVNGQDVVQTSSNGLGIAIHYGGKVISPTDTFTETYQSGYTDITLEFEAVRDPTVEVKDIPTGDFAASAVMIMTEQ